MEKIKSNIQNRLFFVGGNTINNIIKCKNKIVIPQKIQKYVVNWYHTYFLRTGLD